MSRRSQVPNDERLPLISRLWMTRWWLLSSRHDVNLTPPGRAAACHFTFSLAAALLCFFAVSGVSKACAAESFPALSLPFPHNPATPTQVASAEGLGGAIRPTAEGIEPPTTLEKLARVLTLRDYNTRVVLVGTSLLGVAAGMVGSFMLLRKRALVGDVVSHAALPGIAGGFLLLETLRPGSGKSVPGLLLGALVAGLLAMGSVIVIRRLTRLKDDAALAIVLSVFFGAGVALFTIVQSVPTGNQAGLQGFIFGKTASLVAADVEVIGRAAIIAVVLCGLLFKELTLLCFDEEYAKSQGWPTLLLDVMLMTLVAVVTVIGLESVGLLLVVALLIVPPAAARFWTDRVGAMTLVAAAFGAASTVGGATLSAIFPKVAAGAVIVLVASLIFLVSLVLSPHRGIVRRVWSRLWLKNEVERQHLLRAVYELIEAELSSRGEAVSEAVPDVSVAPQQLQQSRPWTGRRLRRLLDRAERQELLYVGANGRVRLTSAGWAQARRVARNHRLWELFLLTHADMAVERVDRYADYVEHALDAQLLEELQRELAERYPGMQAVPPSPHEIEAAPTSADTRRGEEVGR